MACVMGHCDKCRHPLSCSHGCHGGVVEAASYAAFIKLRPLFEPGHRYGLTVSPEAGMLFHNDAGWRSSVVAVGS